MNHLRNAQTILLCILLAACERPQNANSSDSHHLQATTVASSSRWKAGRDFVVLTPSPTTSLTENVVTEFFWYGCPHCYTFEPHLALWLRTKEAARVKFIRVPSVWGVRDRQHARLFYTLEALRLDDLHHEVFDVIHRKGNALSDHKSDGSAFALQLTFVRSFGIDETEFTRVYHSTQISSKVAEAERLNKAYKVEALPSLVVNGKYRSDFVLTHGRASDLIELTNHLITAR